MFFLVFVLLTVASQSVTGEDLASNRIPSKIVDGILLASSGSPKQLYDLVSSKGNGAWYAAAETAAVLGFTDLAQSLWKKSYKDEQTPFALKSLLTLLNSDSEAFFFPLAELKSAEKKYGSSDVLREAKIAVLEALNRQKALAHEIGSFTGRPWEASVLAAALIENRNEPLLQETAARFVLHCADPNALKEIPVRDYVLNPAVLILSAARIDYADGNHESALTYYQRWLYLLTENPEICELEDPPPVFEEMAKAAIQTGQEETWADILDEAADYLTGAKSYGAAFNAGQLYRKANQHRNAVNAFRKAAYAVPKGLDTDKTIWLTLKTFGTRTAFPLAEELEIFSWAAVEWDNPNRFIDVMGEFIHRRVYNLEWRELAVQYHDRESYWPDQARAKAALALAFATAEGKVRGENPKFYLEEAHAAAPLSWWGLRAAGLLDTKIKIAGSIETQELGDEDLTALALLEWGLFGKVSDDILQNPENYSAQIIRAAAAALSESNPRLSIRVINLLFNRKDYEPNRTDLLLRHPLPLQAEAVKAADEFSIPHQVFFGLIKTESAWDAQAVSRSGAKGLTQFMPATWEEWVTRLKYPKDTSPMNPEINLRFGAAYLNWLRSQNWTGGWMDILASYNAGGGRLRNWRQQRSFLGDDLFAISIPVEEPRHYIAKVLSAATLYGYLYSGQLPKELHESLELPGIKIY